MQPGVDVWDMTENTAAQFPKNYTQRFRWLTQNLRNSLLAKVEFTGATKIAPKKAEEIRLKKTKQC